MDPAEEIIFVSSQDDLGALNAVVKDKITLAVTLNRESGMFTVWRLQFEGEEDTVRHEKKAAVEKKVPRRRSSFMPGTGATTPVPGASQTFRESFGGIQSQAMKGHTALVDRSLDFASSLDPDAEINAIPRRKSRRVSSMLARGDLSTSAANERPMYGDIKNSHGAYADPKATVNTRASFGGRKSFRQSTSRQTPLNASLNSFLEAPIDDLLDELKAGGDFEGFGALGLDDEDFAGLKREVCFTKLKSVPDEHTTLRFSAQNQPAEGQYRVFALCTSAPSRSSTQQFHIVLCILDIREKRFLVISLVAVDHESASRTSKNMFQAHGKPGERELDLNYVNHVRADNVMDACKVVDGDTTRIMVLSQTADGFGELTLQAPWSMLTKVVIPRDLLSNNLRSLGNGHGSYLSRDSGLHRVLSKAPGALRRLVNPMAGGIFDVVDDNSRLHQVRVKLEPRLPLAKLALKVCQFVMPGREGESIYACWWNVEHWLKQSKYDCHVEDWSAVVVVLFTMVLSLCNLPADEAQPGHRRSRSSLLNQRSQPLLDVVHIDDVFQEESQSTNGVISWGVSNSWNWLLNPEPTAAQDPVPNSMANQADGADENGFVRYHYQLAKEFMRTELGEAAAGSNGYLPTAPSVDTATQSKAVSMLIQGLNVLHESLKLDITRAESTTLANASLTPVLAQLTLWLGWEKWAKNYLVEDAALHSAMFVNCRYCRLLERTPLISCSSETVNSFAASISTFRLCMDPELRAE
jgi:anaphase-promoting complex subunit 1